MTTILNITKTEGRVTTLHFDGHLDAQTENLAVESARTSMNAGARFLLIDMSSVEMISSAGLRALHSIYKLFTPHEEERAWIADHPDETYKSPYFKLAAASPQVNYVLSISGFLQNIPIYPSVKEASDSFG